MVLISRALSPLSQRPGHQRRQDKAGQQRYKCQTRAVLIRAFSVISSTKDVPCDQRADRGHESQWQRYPRYRTGVEDQSNHGH